ncbi:glycerophosphodiester phosphodiesterase [Brevibacillus massiliensis]|uniref:glycerophosphodiester phosphodiesterase n=1 Tax=Brevibacillus massiliensis TaxID=1118054 RepID=UPI0002E4A698|nr:glycerophosphodiester phosphodiesterase family protein [Brevibacillus massiliensis]
MNICMAHRGWSGKAPENTMAAIKLALSEPSVRAIEVDVQFSADGVPVLFHDFTLERTTDGRGLLADHTYRQLRALDAGGWMDARYSKEPIPTLEEALTAVKGKCTLNIELKMAGEWRFEQVKKVVQLVEQFDMASEVYITSFQHEALRFVHELAPGIKTGLIIYGKPVLLFDQLQAAGASVISMAYPYLTPDFVQLAIAEGYTVIAWTVDDPQVMRTIMGWHRDIQICTNHPDLMPEVKYT